MTSRRKYQISSEVGVYSMLTNSYCVIGVGIGGTSDMFRSVIDQEL